MDIGNTRNTRSRTKVLSYKEGGDSEEEIEVEPEHVSPIKPKSKKKNRISTVPYQQVHIPFGFADKEIESLLSYRNIDGNEEALVKYKYTSYHHTEWLSRETIEDCMPQGKHRFKKLISSYESNPDQYDEPFNNMFLEIDRVLDEGEITDDDEQDGLCVYGLVKWDSLPYEQATWEKVEKIKELNNEKYQEFVNRSEFPGVLKVIPKGSFNKLIESPKFKGDNMLRDYQLEGLNWLTYCWFNNRSSIMADEMGLGKTVQSVSFIHHIYKTYNIRGPFLIVAPLSTIPHWEREFKSWTDLNVIVYHGSSSSRNIIVDTEFYYKDEDGDRLSNLYKMHVVITTYEMILSGAAQLSPIHWKVGIFDEAHRLKNRNSKVLEILKTYTIDHRVLLTGTPLQNSVTELFSLLNFLDPTRFNDEKLFLQEFGELKSATEVAQLQSLLKPLMLRRFKEDVEKSIPSKQETVIEVELTSIQKTWYRAILEKNFTYLKKGGKGEGPSLNNIMMELRKCCNHPFLIKGAEELILKDINEKNEQQSYLQSLIQTSGKMVLLDKLLPKLKESGHKVLIFSQMTKVLDLLAEYMHHKDYDMERIDGGVKSQDRQLAIDRFTNSSTSFTFLLCTRAGGVGINLTAADTVIIFDSDWNPQNDLQAQARVHRIGQKKSVKIYRLLCANTYERQMFDRANLKLGLDKAVMQKMDGYNDNNNGLSKKEVDDLLKLGAYGALLDDTESSKFYEEDIDSILQRRSTVINYDNNEKGSAFSKASFSAFEEDNTDLNDPLFWDKWAAKADLDTTKLNEVNPLIIDEPRTRKRTKRFEYAKEIKAISNNDEDSQDEFIDDKVKGPRLWTSSGRAKLERKLMIHGLSNWQKLAESFTRRDIKDIRACVHHLISTMVKHNKSNNSDNIKDYEDIENALLLDLKLHDEQGIDFDHLHNDLNIPYPDADKNQIAEFRSFLVEAPTEYIDKVHNKSKSLLQRIQVIYQICEKMVPKDEKELQDWNAPDAGSGAPPAPWWDTRMDKDLLIGIAKHGYHQYDTFRLDPELIFSKFNFTSPESSPSPNDEDQKQSSPSKKLKSKENSEKGDDMEEEIDEIKEEEQEKEEKYYWPLGVDIGLRIRKLINSYQKSANGVTKKANKEIKPTNNSYLERVITCIKEDVELEDEIEMDPTWSAREIKNFSKTLSSFGIECNSINLFERKWNRFRLISELYSKKDEDFENYFSQYIKMCYDALNHESGSEVRERNLTTMGFLIKLMPTLKSNTLKLNIDIPTAEKAKRAIKRIMQMHYLRHKVYHSEDIKLILAQARKIQGMPNWWSHQFEIAFVKALILYGIAGDNYTFNDNELPFGDKKENWPREIVITKHIDQLLEIADKLERRKNKKVDISPYFNHSNNDSKSNENNEEVKSNEVAQQEQDNPVTINKVEIKPITQIENLVKEEQIKSSVSPKIHNNFNIITNSNTAIPPSKDTTKFIVCDSDSGPILTKKKPKDRNSKTTAIVKITDDDSQPKITTFFKAPVTLANELKFIDDTPKMDNGNSNGNSEGNYARQANFNSLNHLLNPTTPDDDDDDDEQFNNGLESNYQS